MRLKIVVVSLVFFMSVGTANAFSLFGDSKLCKIYEDTFVSVNKQIAHLTISQIGDSSAIRANRRQNEIVSNRILQLITLEQMKAYNCDIPKPTSGNEAWTAAALKCKTAEVENAFGRVSDEEFIEICDRDNWQSIFDNEHPFYQ